jgi:hypothetical protein
VTWAILLILVAWFAYASPKTPLQFYDAAKRDWARGEQHQLARHQAADPAYAKQIEESAEILSCIFRQNRLELLYDLEHNPKHIRAERSAIVGGFYSPETGTKEHLLAASAEYRALAQQIETRKAQRRSQMAASRPARAEHSDVGSDYQWMAEFALPFWRAFQARVFWWEGT